MAPLQFTFVPADITVEAASGDSGAIVNYPTPTAAGGVGQITGDLRPAIGLLLPDRDYDGHL